MGGPTSAPPRGPHRGTVHVPAVTRKLFVHSIFSSFFLRTFGFTRETDISIVIVIAIATTIAIIIVIVGITAVSAVAVAAVAAVAVAAVTANPD